MLKRIFVGIPLSREVSGQVMDWVGGHQRASARWISAKNLHITLVPPWNEGDIGNIIYKLQTIQAGDFEIDFNKIVASPNKNMLWMTGDVPKEILDLRLKIYEALGQKQDEWPFKLHTTLARSKNSDLPYLKEKVEWKMKAEKFVLYESRLLPEGADYEILQSFPLS